MNEFRRIILNSFSNSFDIVVVVALVTAYIFEFCANFEKKIRLTKYGTSFIINFMKEMKKRFDMKKIISLIALLVLLTGCAGSMKNGVALLEEGKYDAAVEAFQKNIKNKRNLDEAYRGLGIAYFELEDYEAAVEAFELALEHETKETAVCCSFLGASYLETGDYDKALDVYERGLACKDLTEELEQEIQLNLIVVYERMGNWDAAKKQMDKYVEKYPDDNRVDKEAEFLETR